MGLINFTKSNFKIFKVITYNKSHFLIRINYLTTSFIKRKVKFFIPGKPLMIELCFNGSQKNKKEATITCSQYLTSFSTKF